MSSDQAWHCRYAGRRIDEQTGLYDLRERSLHSAVGRFSMRDPMVYYDGPNLYQYVLARPLDHSDPFGLGCRVPFQCVKKVAEHKGYCVYECNEVFEPTRHRTGTTVVISPDEDAAIDIVTCEELDNILKRIYEEEVERAKKEGRPIPPPPPRLGEKEQWHGMTVMYAVKKGYFCDCPAPKDVTFWRTYTSYNPKGGINLWECLDECKKAGAGGGVVCKIVGKLNPVLGKVCKALMKLGGAACESFCVMAANNFKSKDDPGW